MYPAVTMSQSLPVPVDEVWRWLRDPELIARWHGWASDELADEIELIYGSEPQELKEGEGRTLVLGSGDTFRLTPEGEGSLLTLTLPPPRGEIADYWPEVVEGWTAFLEQLRFALVHHPHEERRTIHLFAPDDEDARELDLARVPTQLGSAWYATELQTGHVLPQLGPGLVTVSRGTDGRSTRVVVTTYGLSDEQVAEQAASWQSWLKESASHVNDPEF